MLADAANAVPQLVRLAGLLFPQPCYRRATCDCRQPSILSCAIPSSYAVELRAGEVHGKAVDRGDFRLAKQALSAKCAGAVDATGRFPLAGGMAAARTDTNVQDFQLYQRTVKPGRLCSRSASALGQWNVLGIGESLPSPADPCSVAGAALYCFRWCCAADGIVGVTLCRAIQTKRCQPCPSKPTRAGPFRRRSGCKVGAALASEVIHDLQVTRQILVLSLGMLLLPSWALARTAGSTTTTTSSTAKEMARALGRSMARPSRDGRCCRSLVFPIELNHQAGGSAVGGIVGPAATPSTSFSRTSARRLGRPKCPMSRTRAEDARDPRLAGLRRMVSRSTARCTSDGTTARTRRSARRRGRSASRYRRQIRGQHHLSIKPRLPVAGSPNGHRAARRSADMKPRPVGTSPTGYEYVSVTRAVRRRQPVLLGPDSSPATCKLPGGEALRDRRLKDESVGSGSGGLMVYWSVPGAHRASCLPTAVSEKEKIRTSVMSDDFWRTRAVTFRRASVAFCTVVRTTPTTQYDGAASGAW